MKISKIIWCFISSFIDEKKNAIKIGALADFYISNDLTLMTGKFFSSIPSFTGDDCAKLFQ